MKISNFKYIKQREVKGKCIVCLAPIFGGRAGSSRPGAAVVTCSKKCSAVHARVSGYIRDKNNLAYSSIANLSKQIKRTLKIIKNARLGK